jgi:hypothetical protein
VGAGGWVGVGSVVAVAVGVGVAGVPVAVGVGVALGGAPVKISLGAVVVSREVNDAMSVEDVARTNVYSPLTVTTLETS